MKRLLGQLSWTAASQIVATAAILLGQAVLARTVPLKVFGTFAAAQALVSLIEAATVGRGGEVALQYLGHNWKQPQIVGAVARRLLGLEAWYCLLAFGGVLLLAVPIEWLLHVHAPYVMALAATIPLQIGYGIRRSTFMLNDNMRGQARLEIVSALLLGALTVGLTLPFGVWGMIGGLVGWAGLKNLLAHIVTASTWRKIGRGSETLDPVIMGGLRAASGHSILRNLLSNGTSSCDMLILTAAGLPEAVAFYRVARTLASIPAKAASPLWAVLRPQLLSALRDDAHGRYVKVVGKASGVFMLLLVLIGIPVTFVFGPMVLVQYGPQYVDALAPLMILLIGNAILGAVTGWLSFTLVISSRKALGSAIFALQLAFTLSFGWFFGRHSAVHMALVVTAGSIFVSAIAWAALLTGQFRMKSAAAA